jgi:hypothetical protein
MRDAQKLLCGRGRNIRQGQQCAGKRAGGGGVEPPPARLPACCVPQQLTSASGLRSCMTVELLRLCPILIYSILESGPSETNLELCPILTLIQEGPQQNQPEAVTASGTPGRRRP